MGAGAGRPVRPSYSFMGVYYNEAVLLPHRDNHQCEYAQRTHRARMCVCALGMLVCAL